MRAAIYARKSTDDNDRDDANKSVTRQVEQARKYAEGKGWTVDDAHIYTDDGISGAEYKNRPGLLRLINHIREFNMLVMSESSRLGRDMTRNAAFVVDIIDSNVRIFYYLTDEEEKADTPEQKIMMTLRSFASEVERDKASQRARDALTVKARKGYNTGGIVFGYDNVVVYGTNGCGEQVKSHTDYKVNEEQADVIRRMFRMCADGHSQACIAKTMNGSAKFADKSKQYFDGLRPAPPRRGTQSWAPSSVRAILYNQRYLGTVPFGEFRNKWKKGTQTRERQETFERTARPDLRIVSDELWNAAQVELGRRKAAYLRDTGGRLWGRPSSGLDSRYLLSGNARCGCCGASMVVIGGNVGVPGKRKPRFYYGCSYHSNRGETVCANDRRVHMETADDMVLSVIEQKVLTPDVLDATVDRAAEIMRERQSSQRDLPERLEEQLRVARRKLDNLLRAIAGGHDSPASVLALITQLEGEITTTEARLEQTRATVPAAADLRDLKAYLRSRLDEFRALMRGDVAKARQVLRKLLKEPMKFLPLEGSGYQIAGEMRIGAFLAIPSPFGLGYVKVASPRGVERHISTFAIPGEAWLRAA